MLKIMVFGGAVAAKTAGKTASRQKKIKRAYCFCARFVLSLDKIDGISAKKIKRAYLFLRSICIIFVAVIDLNG